MKKDIAKKWCDALRNGPYEQAEGVLKDNNGFCCLGVLTDIYIKETGLGKWSTLDNSFEWERDPYDDFEDDDGSVYTGSEGTELPPPVMEWAGMVDANGHFDKTDSKQHLVNYNDGEDEIIKKTDFNGIADLIEKNVENL